MFAFLAVACAPRHAAPGSTLADNGRIAIGTTSFPRTLDPADAYDLISGNILYNTIERLYTYKPGSLELVPQLAAAMPEVSADGLTYRIPVRQGVTFHDGTPFDARAMAFSLQRFIALGGSPAFLLGDVIDRVAAPTPTEVVIQLKRPLPFFPQLLAFTGAGAISPAAYGSGKEFLPNRIVGTGPYKLTQYEERTILRLDAFDGYWGEKPANRGIDIQFYSSAANLFNAFKTGAVDVAYQTLSPNQIRNITANANVQGWTVASAQGSVVLFMTVNVEKPPLNDLRVRQALAAAIDRPLLQERVFFGQRLPAYSLVPNTLPGYKPVFQSRYGDGNGRLAQRLLREAGYSETNPAQVAMWYSPKYAGNGDLVASTLQAAIARHTGGLMRVTIEKADKTVAYAFIDRGVYDTFLLDWVPDFFDADNFLQPFLACEATGEGGCAKGGPNYWGSMYHSDRMNDLIDRQRAERDPGKRQQLLGEIQDLLAQDVPFIPLWQNREYAFAGKGVAGVAIEPTQQLPYWTIHRIARSRDRSKAGS